MKKWISLYPVQDKKHISIKAFLTGDMVFFKDDWPWNEFERFVVSFSTIRLKDEVNFSVREFSETFYSPSVFRGHGYNALKGIFLLKKFTFK